MNTLRTSCMAIAFLVSLPLAQRGATTHAPIADGHASEILTKISFRDGITRTVRLEGVGCTSSMCSRTAIKGQTKEKGIVSIWLDTIAAIRDTTDANALFIMRDETRQRFGLLKDFRVLYLASSSGVPEKVDLSRIKTVEFVSSR